jgi:3-mercaptopyruvate sulfurtransferase SseA
MKTATLTFCLIAFALAAVALGCQTASTNLADNKPAANAASSNNAAPAASQPADDAPRIELAAAKTAFDSEAALFVDTRPASAYDGEHIKGAVNIPMDKLAEKIKDLPKDKKIIAYCS